MVQYLISKGVSPQRLVAAGFGEFQPLDPGTHRGRLPPQSPARAEADGAVTPGDLALRPYVAADEEAAIELWRRTWQHAYPNIDFVARLDWWRERWRTELVPACAITVAMAGDGDGGLRHRRSRAPAISTRLVVAPEAWGGGAAAALVDAAKRVAPSGLDLHVNRDNARAIRFYEKHGFAVSGEEVNPRSGAPIYRMSWRGNL